IEAESWIEMSVLSKYFFYQIFNILLFLVGNTIWQAINLSQIANIIDILGDTLPKTSPSMMGYIILQALAVNPAQLLVAGPLALTWLTRLAPWSRNSPRDISDAYYPSLLTSINYGVAYTVPLVVWVIGLTYAAIAPLILPFCALFFGLGYFINKYLLLYVHLPKYETGGMHAPMAVRRCLAGLVVMQLTMMGVLALKYRTSEQVDVKSVERERGFVEILMDPPAWSAYAQTVACLLPLLGLTFLLYAWFREGYDKLVNNVPMEILGKVVRDLSKENNNGIGSNVNGGETGANASRSESLAHPSYRGEELSSVNGGFRGDGDNVSLSSVDTTLRFGHRHPRNVKAPLGRGREQVGLVNRPSTSQMGSPLRPSAYRNHSADDEEQRPLGRRPSIPDILPPFLTENGRLETSSSSSGTIMFLESNSHSPRDDTPQEPPLPNSIPYRSPTSFLDAATTPPRKTSQPRDSFFSIATNDEVSLFDESELGVDDNNIL
ncbi:hypothetical protein HDV05_001688, partial [Chytridiales sp. JEL 0842]